MIAAGLETFITALPLASELARYDFGTGTAPAVFSILPVPSDARQPNITIVEQGNSAWGCRDKIGAEVTANVTLWGDRERSDKSLRDMAWELYANLHHANVTFTGWDNWGVYATPPESTKSDDGFPGYQISVLCRVLQT